MKKLIALGLGLAAAWIWLADPDWQSKVRLLGVRGYDDRWPHD